MSANDAAEISRPASSWLMSLAKDAGEVAAGKEDSS